MMTAGTTRTTLHSILLVFLVAAASSQAGQFVVRSTADAGAHSLRWAILQANAAAGPDVISFEIPGNGPLIIVPASPLPALTDPAGVIIDGLSQEGCSAGTHPPATLTLRIVLDGVHAGRGPGLCLQSSNNLIQGLVITRFAEDGLRIQGMPGGTQGNVVRNCIVGLDAEGSEARPNCMDEGALRSAGVRIYADPAAPGDAFENSILTCVISGNSGDGILITDCPGADVRGNIVSGNFIGCTRSGDVARGNARDGVQLFGGCHGNTISANVIGGNGSDGIHLTGDAARKAAVHGNSISRNRIGITPENRPIGNAVNGINLGGREYGSEGGFASGNIVTSNFVAANGRSGIVVWEHPATTDNGDGNRLTQNSVFNNGRLGIDLGDDGVSLNDLADRDVGPNQNRNAPVLLSADINDKLVMLRGNIDLGSLRREAKVELYKLHSGPVKQFQDALYLGTVSPDA
ncbi:MAG: right-handed parallel beta-helix repeat-containing protein, partial [Bacteroidota bacterium]|nr:right-handed parallel beta-helix repeat-containing protein [Bacteroidota bacterium]